VALTQSNTIHFFHGRRDLLKVMAGVIEVTDYVTLSRIKNMLMHLTNSAYMLYTKAGRLWRDCCHVLLQNVAESKAVWQNGALLLPCIDAECG
jgi:hypothetical protein